MKYLILTLVNVVISIQCVSGKIVTAIDKDIICTLSKAGVGLDPIAEYGFFHLLPFQDVNSTSLSCDVYAAATKMVVATTPVPITTTTTTTKKPTTTTTTKKQTLPPLPPIPTIPSIRVPPIVIPMPRFRFPSWGKK